MKVSDRYEFPVVFAEVGADAEPGVEGSGALRDWRWDGGMLNPTEKPRAAWRGNYGFA